MTAINSAKVAKQLLRKEVKLKILQLSPDEKYSQSKVVTKKLLGSKEWNASKKISVFLNMNDEISTVDILQAALMANKECYIPRYAGSTMDMLRLYSWQDYQSLPETSWKIKQPADEDNRESAFESGGLDLILVPGLAFTRTGHRLGRGKGFYDSYLAKHRELTKRSVMTVALAFREQIYDEIPTSEHDVTIDMVFFADECA